MADLIEPYFYGLVDRGLVPDIAMRRAILALTRYRLKTLDKGSVEKNHEAKMQWIDELRTMPIAVEQEKANEQHYEVSTPFIVSLLGPRMKYSSCYYPTGKESLAQAEEAMLNLYTVRAKLVDGMDILDLGCGWGSLSLFLAEKYPNSKITSLSNSKSQKTFIDNIAKSKGFKNLEVRTGDVRTYDFAGDKSFDRVLSIEMFEHMKNYQKLLAKISTWLKPNSEAKGSDGSLLFVHIFCHKDHGYHFLPEDGWMARYFFSGGTMPSFDTFSYFQDDLTLTRSWYLPGTHYAHTIGDWLKKQDAGGWRFVKAGGFLEGDASEQDQKAMFYRWRLFFLTGTEFFAIDEGNTYGIGHYLFKKRD